MLETCVENAEAAIVDAAIGGDIHAFGRLYDRHLDRIYRHIYYRIGNRSDAEDITQQVFLQAWTAIGRYRRTDVPFVVWLLAIANNKIIEYYRRSKVAASHQNLEIAHDRCESNPENEVLARYERETVRRAITRLKPEQQFVLNMRFVENISYETLATSLGKTEGNVRTIQYRALLELRRILNHSM